MNTRQSSWPSWRKKISSRFMSITITQQLAWASGVLDAISDSPRLDSEILLAHCLQQDRSYLITWPERELSERQIECFQQLVRRRLEPQPIAYLVGSREFYSLQLETTPATLVPRPETEMLVDKTLELLQGLDSPQLLELGTGTGAIALALKKQRPDIELTATDISAEALQVASRNAQKHHLQINFLQSDWYTSVHGDMLFDVIVSNPPYIAADDPYLARGDLPAEPHQALSSGSSGLEALQIIISGAEHFLQPGGWLVLEHGYDQQLEVQQLLREQGYEQVQTFNDFNDLPRLSMARRKK